jgi:HlyD family secretion protein
MRRSLWVVLLVACSHKSEPEDEPETLPAAQVTCAPVAKTEVDDVVEVSGVIAAEPRLDAIVSSPVAGRVAKLAVEEGDTVAAGALLAVIDDPGLPADSISAHADVASAEAAKEAADQELARQQRLVDTGIGARRDLEDARAKARAAAATLEGAHARSGLASKRLARSELRAPHAGVILHVWKRAGETVDGTSATPVVEVADLTNLELHAHVSAATLGELRESMSAKVHVLGRETYDGEVVRIAPAVDPTTLLGTVRIRLTGAKGVTVGSAATGSISTGRHPALVVPAAALRRSSVGADELVVCAGGKADVRTVVVGVRGDKTVEIKSGLEPGQQIVVDHVLGIEQGQQLGAHGGR